MAEAKDLRIEAENDAPTRASREFVLYWMTEARRTRWNRALSRAIALANSLSRPLLVLETLCIDDRYASARSHRFVLDGMADQAARFEAAGIAYYPYVEPVPGAGEGLPLALAERACAVVADASPRLLAARARAAAAKAIDVRLESVDGAGLLPRAAIREALDDPAAFRRRLRSVLPAVVFQGVDAAPLAKPPSRGLDRLPKEIADRWHPARKALLDGDRELLARLSIDASVPPSERRGGEVAATAAWLAAFRAPAAQRGTAGATGLDACDLDAWIHAGHLSVEEIAHELLLREGCIPSVDLRKDDDRPEGWWHAGPAVDRLLERIVVRREHAMHRAERRSRDVDRYESLPIEARRVLEARASHPSRPRADILALEAARGPDASWNALEERLRSHGTIAPAARREWVFGLLDAAPTPRDAYDLAIHLLSRYAIEGGDPFALAEAASVFRDVPVPTRARGPKGPRASRLGSQAAPADPRSRTSSSRPQNGGRAGGGAPRPRDPRASRPR